MAIVNKSLSEQIYQELRRLIVTGTLQPGEKLSNRALQEKYEVSSTPIRDAVIRLYHDGLIENMTNSGAKVAVISPEHAIEINDVLSVLCSAAVEGAIDSGKAEQIAAETDEIICQLENVSSLDMYFEYERKFYLLFFCYTGNSELTGVFSRYLELFELLSRRFHDMNHGDEDRCIYFHRQFLTAFRTGDRAASVEAMKMHFRSANEFFSSLQTEAK